LRRRRRGGRRGRGRGRGREQRRERVRRRRPRRRGVRAAAAPSGRRARRARVVLPGLSLEHRQLDRPGRLLVEIHRRRRRVVSSGRVVVRDAAPLRRDVLGPRGGGGRAVAAFRGGRRRGRFLQRHRYRLERGEGGSRIRSRASRRVVTIPSPSSVDANEATRRANAGARGSVGSGSRARTICRSSSSVCSWSPDIVLLARGGGTSCRGARACARDRRSTPLSDPVDATRRRGRSDADGTRIHRVHSFIAGAARARSR